MKRNTIKKIIALGGLGVMLTLFQNCGGFTSNKPKFEMASEALQLQQKAPTVDCVLRRASDNAILRRINSASPAESFQANVVEGESARLDCTSSAAGSHTPSALTFKLTNKSAGMAVTESTTGFFDLDFPEADRVKMALEIRDESGLATVKDFDIIVRCGPSATAPAIDANAISVSPGSKPGYFNFSAEGAVSGGRGPGYQYSWDFNGDSGSDIQKESDNSFASWSDSARKDNVYTLMANTRKVKLMVRDECNLVAKVDVDVDFEFDRLAANANAEARDYYYMQADIRPGSSSGPPKTTTVDMMAVQPLNPPDDLQHVQCTYNRDPNTNKGTFSIVAKNIYGDQSLVSLDHGMYMEIDNISDNGAKGQVGVGAPKVKLAKYNVAEIMDFANAAVYQTSACTLRFRMVRAEAVVPCGSSGSGTKTVETLTFYGDDFDCNSLNNSMLGDVKALNGKFYCEQAKIDQCVGGGGGGGGGIPPVPQ